MSITKISNFQSDATHFIHLHIPPALSGKSVEGFWRMYLNTRVWVFLQHFIDWCRDK